VSSKPLEAGSVMTFSTVLKRRNAGRSSLVFPTKHGSLLVGSGFSVMKISTINVRGALMSVTFLLCFAHFGWVLCVEPLLCSSQQLS
jgi:hypothetical protein